MVLFRKGGNVTIDQRELLQSTDSHLAPNIKSDADNAAFQHVRESLGDIKNSAGANDTDLIFLQGLMDSPTLRSIVKAQDKLESPTQLAPKPVSSGNVELIKEVVNKCEKFRSHEALELRKLVSKPHFRALIETHDTVVDTNFNNKNNKSTNGHTSKINNKFNSSPSGSKHPSSSYSEEKPPPDILPKKIEDSPDIMPADAIRMVGLRKSPNEPLGLTVEVDESGNLVIARIIAGGMIDRQGLLHVGDAIREVNGAEVNTPEELQVEIARARESVTLRVVPSYELEAAVSGQVMAQKSTTAQATNEIPKTASYMRALFDYDPSQDSLIPCQEIGLAFQHGDILQIVNQSDPNWWQAKKVGGSGSAGLIPSQELEERRKAFVEPEKDYVHKIGMCGTRISKKKKTTMYQSKQNSEFDKAELILYEEVTKMPPFRRKTLALVGCHGVGRRTLKNRLINSDTERFGAVIPHTSRPQRELEETGKSYWFEDRATMEKDIKEHAFLEYGEHNGHLYGTKLDSIRNIIRSGKMCVLDCSPAALKILHNSAEFMPYVIFIAAPGMEAMRNIYENGTSTFSNSRNLNFDRASLRYSSRRARTLESLASLYEEEDIRRTLDESSFLQRSYEKYIDLVIVNEDFDLTFRRVAEALDNLSTSHQWVPVNWVY